MTLNDTRDGRIENVNCLYLKESIFCEMDEFCLQLFWVFSLKPSFPNRLPKRFRSKGYHLRPGILVEDHILNQD